MDIERGSGTFSCTSTERWYLYKGLGLEENQTQDELSPSTVETYPYSPLFCPRVKELRLEGPKGGQFLKTHSVG